MELFKIPIITSINQVLVSLGKEKPFIKTKALKNTAAKKILPKAINNGG